MTHRNFCLVDLLCVVAMFRIFRIWVEMQNANIDLVALVEGAQCRFPDQHGALHLALVPLPHDQAKVLTKICLGLQDSWSGSFSKLSPFGEVTGVIFHDGYKSIKL